MESKHTYIEYKFPNGETIKCTVAFRFLLKLREQNKKVYEKLNNCLRDGIADDLAESVYALYGAYLCACYAGENGGTENIMKESEFIDAVDDDLLDVFNVCAQFLNKKKN